MESRDRGHHAEGRTIDISDEAVVAGLGRHEEWALGELIQSYGKYVYGMALRVVRDARLAQEVAQETVLVMWWNPERFDSAKGTLRSFLMGVARFKAIDVVRRDGGTRSRDSLLAQSTEFLDSPSADKGAAEGIDVRAALSGLSRIQRHALFLAYFRGLTYRQVASVLEVPEGTIKTRIRDGLIKLRETLAAPPGIA